MRPLAVAAVLLVMTKVMLLKANLGISGRTAVPAACTHLVPDATCSGEMYPCAPSPQEGDFQRNTHLVGGYAGKQAFGIKPMLYLCYEIIQTAAEGQFPRAPLAWLAAASSR